MWQAERDELIVSSALELNGCKLSNVEAGIFELFLGRKCLHIQCNASRLSLPIAERQPSVVNSVATHNMNAKHNLCKMEAHDFNIFGFHVGWERNPSRSRQVKISVVVRACTFLLRVYLNLTLPPPLVPLLKLSTFS